MVTTTAKNVMTPDPEHIHEDDTIQEAAKLLARLNIGAMPICDGEKLRGMLTDRDIVTKVVAQGKDPSKVKARELETGDLVWVRDDSSLEDAMRTMAHHKIRRLPVIDSNRKLVGMLSQADVVKALPKDKAGEMVEAISRD